MKKDGVWVTKEAYLLNDISGQAIRGEIMAIMGPSGAGKSTFLDALAGRIAQGSLEGSVKIDGKSSATHTYIGDEGRRGVSGGERRRVSIGIDIIHKPSLLFLDEPTSGLDSTSAFSVVEKVKDIARGGSIVLMTIHQPSYRIQMLLDRITILARDGIKPDPVARTPIPKTPKTPKTPRTPYMNTPGSKHALSLRSQAFSINGNMTSRTDSVQFDFDDDDDNFGNSPPCTLLDSARTPGTTPGKSQISGARSQVSSRYATPQQIPSRPKTPVVFSSSVEDSYAASYEDFDMEEEEVLDEPAHGPKFANPWLREVAVLSWRTALNVVRTLSFPVERNRINCYGTNSFLTFQEPE
ncbi:hypothetical protein GH714_023808 [Hevea brasiliensis]|uniref:ABC transporter domain-containing protein n=1 Tax=Hevea brasiliensis TaxID=3981 RepID=A0A6A6MWP8_HEVBR|nr:hypothetical protein GH714_023808 [Hevea brasiliensis]